MDLVSLVLGRRRDLPVGDDGVVVVGSPVNVILMVRLLAVNFLIRLLRPPQLHLALQIGDAATRACHLGAVSTVLEGGGGFWGGEARGCGVWSSCLLDNGVVVDDPSQNLIFNLCEVLKARTKLVSCFGVLR